MSNLEIARKRKASFDNSPAKRLRYDDPEDSEDYDDPSSPVNSAEPLARRTSALPLVTFPPTAPGWKVKPTAPTSGACPIDFNIPALSGLKPRWRAAWEIRTPWRPEKPTMNQVTQRDTLNEQFGEKFQNETWRRMFMKANKLIFRATGMWWLRERTGLDEIDVGKPPQNYNIGAENHARGREKDQDEPPKQRRARKMMKYEGETLTFHIQEPGMGEGKWQEKREVPLDDAREMSGVVNDLVADETYTMVIETTPKALDILTSCFAPKRRGTLSQYGWRIIEDEDGSLCFLEIPLDFTQHDVMDMYILALILDCPDACDLVLDHFRNTFLQERKLREEYHTGMRLWTDIPSGPVPRILDFEPKQINELWDVSMPDDPARVFWLDVLELKQDIAYEQIQEDVDEYSDAFLRDYNKRLPFARQFALRRRTPEIEEQGEDSETESASDDEDIPIVALESGFANSSPVRDRGSAMYAGERTYPPGYTSPPNPDDLVYRDPSSPTSDTRPIVAHEPYDLIAARQDDFCAIYHHHAWNDTPCYKKSIPRAATSAGDDDDFDAYNESSSSRVTMTINRIPGFKISNHTGYSRTEFRKLPSVFPDWDWERVRAIHCHEQLKFNALQYGRDMKPLILPKPIYFDDAYKGRGVCPFRDQFGRWPSHPGYQDAAWAYDPEVEEEEDDAGGEDRNTVIGEEEGDSTLQDMSSLLTVENLGYDEEANDQDNEFEDIDNFHQSPNPASQPQHDSPQDPTSAGSADPNPDSAAVITTIELCTCERGKKSRATKDGMCRVCGKSRPKRKANANKNAAAGNKDNVEKENEVDEEIMRRPYVDPYNVPKKVDKDWHPTAPAFSKTGFGMETFGGMSLAW